MYKRTEDNIKRSLNGYTGGTAIIEAQFDRASISIDVSPTITTRVDASGWCYLIEDKKGKEDMNKEVKTIVEGMLSGGKWQNMHEQSRRVYSVDGIAPTLHTCGGGNLEPKIKELLDPAEGERERCCLIEDKMEKDNYLMEPIVAASRGCGEMNEQHLEPRTDGVTNTLTTVEKDNLLMEPVGGIYTSTSANFRRPPLPLVSRTLKASSPDAGIVLGISVHTDGAKYRIRKLTERECLRLMGVDDADIDIIKAAGISKTQQYKLAGNSIVVDVLDAIFSNLDIPDSPLLELL